eukprot:4619919-Pleurochrysis_carterae.AAC.2
MAKGGDQGVSRGKGDDFQFARDTGGGVDCAAGGGTGSTRGGLSKGGRAGSSRGGFGGRGGGRGAPRRHCSPGAASGKGGGGFSARHDQSRQVWEWLIAPFLTAKQWLLRCGDNPEAN